jgi:hypothetical protein
MKKFFKLKIALMDEMGAAAPIIGLFIVIFIILLAFAVDLGRLYIVKNELQNTADAAALAGATKLYQTSQTIDVSAVNTAAQNCALQNKSQDLSQLNASVELGKWDFSTQTFTPVANPTNTIDVNAVRTTVKRLGDDGSSSVNPKMGVFFANILGYSNLGTQATAVAYLGITGTSSISIPFALPSSFLTAALNPETQDAFWGLLTPSPAYAAVSTTLTWQDLAGYNNSGGTLDVSKGAWVDDHSSPSYNNVQPYLSGQTKFPQKKVGDKIYPMSEGNYPSYLKNLFSALKTRYDAKKDANGKWKVTIAVYSSTKPTAALPAKKPWYLWAFQAPFKVSEAQACTPLLTPTVYIDGFAVVNITGVSYNSSCDTNLTAANAASCPKTCSMTIEIPLTQNLQTTDASAGGNNFEQTYNSMNSNANPVGVFNVAPKLVK